MMTRTNNRVKGGVATVGFRRVLLLVVLLGFVADLPHSRAALRSSEFPQLRYLAGKRQMTTDAIVKDLRAAPGQVMIRDREIILKAYLWRDFMPISPPNGHPLIAALKLQTTDGSPIPAGVEVVTVWVIYGEALWSPTAKEVLKGGENSQTMEVVVRGGPEWGPGIKVDVVVRLNDGTGQSYLVRASDQNIERTD